MLTIMENPNTVAIGHPRNLGVASNARYSVASRVPTVGSTNGSLCPTLSQNELSTRFVIIANGS